MAKGLFTALKGIDAFGKVCAEHASRFRFHNMLGRQVRMLKLKRASAHFVSRAWLGEDKWLNDFPVTLISAAIIFSVTMMEWMDYRKVTIDTSILVDKSREEKMTVRMNITFPRVPCFRALSSIHKSFQ
jgi:hypothetical protein